MRRPLDRIYIAGPFTNGDREANIWQARDATAAVLRLGLAPICLHTMSPGKVDGLSEADFLQWGLVLLDACDAILMLPGWEESMGANIERDYALAEGARVVWLIRQPSCSSEEMDEPCEALVISNYLGKYDLVKMVI